MKLYEPRLAPAMVNDVVTVTRSPGVNGLLGKKLPPSSSESGWILPPWAPDDDPLTVIGPSCAGEIPRNEIWVDGAANLAPGTGNTLTALAAACAGAGAGAETSVTHDTASTAAQARAMPTIDPTPARSRA